MKTIFAPMLAVALLGGCQAIAPQTYAGFQANGILGALDGASGAVLARCATVDGAEFRVAVDALAGEVGTVSSLEAVRAKREKACAIAGAVQVVAGVAD